MDSKGYQTPLDALTKPVKQRLYCLYSLYALLNGGFLNRIIIVIPFLAALTGLFQVQIFEAGWISLSVKSMSQLLNIFIYYSRAKHLLRCL